MSHKQSQFPLSSSGVNRALTRQQGFLIPVALVIIVGMSALAIAISKMSSQSSNASFREGIAAQAFLAAESGAQFAMNQLFFPDADRTAASAACTSFNNDTLSFTAVGLSSCTTTINCTESASSDAATSYFTVTSSAVCGAGELLSERSVKASAYLQ